MFPKCKKLDIDFHESPLFIISHVLADFQHVTTPSPPGRGGGSISTRVLTKIDFQNCNSQPHRN
jgi:hypothetical protein